MIDTRCFNRDQPTILQSEFWLWNNVWMGNRIDPIHPYNKIEPIEDEL